MIGSHNERFVWDLNQERSFWQVYGLDLGHKSAEIVVVCHDGTIIYGNPFPEVFGKVLCA